MDLYVSTSITRCKPQGQRRLCLSLSLNKLSQGFLLSSITHNDRTAPLHPKQSKPFCRPYDPDHFCDYASNVPIGLQTNDYKNTLSQAKEYASHLPGGELNADEQKALIDMLERLREHKKSVCFSFPFSSCSCGYIGSNYRYFLSVSQAC